MKVARGGCCSTSTCAGSVLILLLVLLWWPELHACRHYRKAILAALPRLQYLDDRPVFEVERVTVDAWVKGGRDAEVAAKKAYEVSGGHGATPGSGLGCCAMRRATLPRSRYLC